MFDMSRQPIYATIEDKNVIRTTSSRRGKITRIAGNVNTIFGNAFHWSTTYHETGYNPPERKGKPKKQYLLEVKNERERCDESRSVITSLNLHTGDKHIIFFVNGVKINNNIMKLLIKLTENPDRMKSVMNAMDL